MQPQPPEAADWRTDSGSNDLSLIRLSSAVLLTCLVLLGALVFIHPAIPLANSERAFLRTTLDINTATMAELSALPNIGPALAERIVSDRETRGRFDSLADLDRVPGIGPRTIEALRPHAAAR